MLSCPKCGKKLNKPPDKELKNTVFNIATYTCDECGTPFKVANYVWYFFTDPVSGSKIK